jgi:multiple antibiotic resistance protein
MDLDWGFTLTFTVTLFSVLNPVHAVPLYLSMAPNHTRQESNQVARVATLTVFVTLIVALVAGEQLLAFFGITIHAFQTAGGILIMMMGLSLLNAQTSRVKNVPEETEEAQRQDSIAVVPLGIPILAGAGSMSTVIMFAHEAHGRQWLELLAGILVNSAAVYAFLAPAPRVNAVLGRTGINLVGRLTGLVLVAMAVQFVADGLHGLFPVLGQPG